MNPVCIQCDEEMYCYKTGALCRAAPYHYYSGDVWQCRRCGTQIMSGFGGSSYQDDGEPGMTAAPDGPIWADLCEEKI